MAGRGARTLQLYVLNVDLGNAALVVTPAGQSMLIDAGPPDQKYTDLILSAMKDAGVRQIDYAVVSHYHWDHYGTLPELSAKVPILNYVDHGPSVEVNRGMEWYKRHGGSQHNPLYDLYLKTREKGNHVVVKPGDKIPMEGVETTILTSGGRVIPAPVKGGGEFNHACWMTGLIADNEQEDSQSVGLLLEFGKFRCINLGDLTWNLSYKLFCHENKVGPVDLYLITHHALSPEAESVGRAHESAAACPPCEVYGLRPRVGILSCREDYVFRLCTPEAWQRIRLAPGLEDIWQTNYQAQGGPENNAPEEFIACTNEASCRGGDWFKVSAEADGSFTVTNKRNGFAKSYPKGKPSRIISPPRQLPEAGATQTAARADTSKPRSDEALGYTLAHTLASHNRFISSVAFSPDGSLLATGGWDGTARLWDVESGKELRVMAHHRMAVRSVAFSPDGRALAVGSDDTTATLWEAGTGRLLKVLYDYAGYVLSVAFSPNGLWLAASTAHGKINLWDLSDLSDPSDRSDRSDESHKEGVLALAGHTRAVNTLVFSSDGRQLISGGRDQTIRFWDIPGGQELRCWTIGPQQYYVHSISLSRDGRALASASSGGGMKLWNVASGECVRTMNVGNTQPYIWPIAFGPDGRWLVSGGGPGRVQFWDVATGEALGALTGHTAGIESVALSTDGRWLASGSDDNTAKLWRRRE